jgi:hypothetical protein
VRGVEDAERRGGGGGRGRGGELTEGDGGVGDGREVGEAGEHCFGGDEG